MHGSNLIHAWIFASFEETILRFDDFLKEPYNTLWEIQAGNQISFSPTQHQVFSAPLQENKRARGIRSLQDHEDLVCSLLQELDRNHFYAIHAGDMRFFLLTNTAENVKDGLEKISIYIIPAGAMW